MGFGKDKFLAVTV